MGQLAARRGFYKLGPVWMRQLVTHLKIEVDTKSPFCVLLTAAIKRFLPDLSEEDLLEILALRANLSAAATDDDVMWGDEIIASVVEEGDKEELEKDKVKEGDQKKEVQSFRKDVADLKDKLFAARHPAKKAKAKAKAGERFPARPLLHENLPKDSLFAKVASLTIW